MGTKKDKKEKKVKDVSDKKKREKKGRKIYPLEEGAKITELPEDFDFAKHKAIGKKLWENDWQYILHRAEECTWRAAALQVKATKMKECGSKKDRSRLARLQKMTAKMAELKAELEASGVDVEALLEADES